MNVLLIDNGTFHLRALQHRLSDHVVVTTKYRSMTERQISEADMIILSGGRTRIIGHYWYFKKELELIRTTALPIIGICLGHELIARAFNAKPVRLTRKIRGIRTLNVMKIEGLSTNNLDVFEAHTYAIKNLPDGFTALAHSPSGIEVMVSKTRLIYGLQFHPEVVQPPNDGLEIFNAILKQIEQRSH